MATNLYFTGQVNNGLTFTGDGQASQLIATGQVAAAGPANVLSIGSVTTGTAGSSASATITGTTPSQVLNLTIPQGAQGVVADATTASKGQIQLAGDLAGTASAPTVPTLSTKAAISGQVFTGAVSATNLSGTNTGDETATTIKSKLGVTTLSGSNTGDQTNITGTAGTITGSITESQVTNLTSDLAAKQAALTLTTTGTSGAATLTSGTLNIPQYSGGGGSGTVTGVSVTTANGVSGTVATPSTTPAISLTLGAITPSSVAASGTVTGSNLSGTNTGDQSIPTSLPPNGTASGDLSGTYPGPTVTKVNGTALSGLATGILKNTTTTGVPSIAIAADFPTLNQNTTGTASSITGNITESQVTNLVSDLALKSPLASPTFTGTPAAPTATAGTNTTQIASTAFVTGAVATAVTGTLNFKGSTDASVNPNYPSANKGDVYIVSVAGKIGGASGPSVDVGDEYFATANNAGGTQAAVGTSWDILEHNLVGALLSANNLSDVASTSTAFSNIKQAATSGATGVIQLAGDLAGTATAPTVAKINGTSLAGLSTGILKNTTTTGVPSIAVAADFPTLNQNTTGTASTITGNITESQVTNLTTDLAARVQGSMKLSQGTTAPSSPANGDLWVDTN